MIKLRIACWNCSGIYGNYFYARDLLKNTDILALSEHWLYNDDLSFLDGLDDQFCYYASSSRLNDNTRRWKRGQGGVGLLWRKNLVVKKIFLSDRLVAIKIKTGPARWSIICGVYLPSTNYSTIDFQNELDALESLCLKERGENDLIILGDFNAHITGARNPCNENM
jgi:exonuclease III